jgi:hypothetical protein
MECDVRQSVVETTALTFVGRSGRPLARYEYRTRFRGFGPGVGLATGLGIPDLAVAVFFDIVFYEKGYAGGGLCRRFPLTVSCDAGFGNRWSPKPHGPVA